MFKRKQESGFAHAFLIILVLIVAVSAAGYFVWSRLETEEEAFNSAPSQPCEGSWIDTHTHLDDMEFSHDIAEQMRASKIGCSVIFTHLDLDDLEISMLEKREEFYPNPGRFILFADIIQQNPKAVTRSSLDNLWSRYPDVFKGFGENAFYREPHKDTSLLEEPWPTIFKFAAEKNIFVMLHLTKNEADDLEIMLTQYPDTKVLLHHRELKSELPDMLNRHKNLFYTLDTTNLLTLSEDGIDDVIMFPTGNDEAKAMADFIRKYDQNRDLLLNEAKEDWVRLFDIAPDRIFWGTDVALGWHTDAEVYKRLMDFSEAFVEFLPPQHREDYKHNNALKQFGSGITLQNLTSAEFDKLDEADSEDD